MDGRMMQNRNDGTSRLGGPQSKSTQHRSSLSCVEPTKVVTHLHCISHIRFVLFGPTLVLLPNSIYGLLMMSEFQAPSGSSILFRNTSTITMHRNGGKSSSFTFPFFFSSADRSCPPPRMRLPDPPLLCSNQLPFDLRITTRNHFLPPCSPTPDSTGYPIRFLLSSLPFYESPLVVTDLEKHYDHSRRN